MSFADREQIFSKDYITTQELETLLGFKHLSDASKMMTRIKRTVGDRLGIKGRIHTEDYFEFFNITDKQRYIKEKL